MPYCHFDLDQTSDYLTHRSGDRRGSAFGSSGAIDPASTRVIEFNSCGVGVKNIKYVQVMIDVPWNPLIQLPLNMSLYYNSTHEMRSPL